MQITSPALVSQYACTTSQPIQPRTQTTLHQQNIKSKYSTTPQPLPSHHRPPSIISQSQKAKLELAAPLPSPRIIPPPAPTARPTPPSPSPIHAVPLRLPSIPSTTTAAASHYRRNPSAYRLPTSYLNYKMTSASPAPSPRTPFPPSPDGAAAPPLPHAPALSSANARARFEFEAGKGAEGSKVLMVEWSVPVPSSGARNQDVWEVSWEGSARGVVYGSGSATVDEGEGGVVADAAAEGAKEEEVTGKLHTHRLYFLLPPPSPVPRLVNISRRGSEAEALRTNPLPAISPPELGASARTAGRKGVLHTRWAKRRVAVLEQEIEREGGLGEGVGWEMAVRERVWIEENFGVGKGAGGREGGVGAESGKAPGSPLGRMAERMRGLKVGTSPGELGVKGEFFFQFLDPIVSSHLAALLP